MKFNRAARGRFGPGVGVLLAWADRFGRPAALVDTLPASAPIGDEIQGADVPREFHRRMAAIIEAVQIAIWQQGVHELLGYATDYALGQERGLQTLVLKTRRRSAYVRLQWDTLMGDSAEDRKTVNGAVAGAIQQLA